MQLSVNRATMPRIEVVHGWLSWVTSTTMCLRSLGVPCDASDVAGFSSYAFLLSINRGVCPSGPTTINWAGLTEGVLALGRSSLCFLSETCFTPQRRDDQGRASARTVFDLAEREIRSGRPCAVAGLGVPEFGVVHGTDRDDFLCVQNGPTPERLAWAELNAPGGPMLFAFPHSRELSPDRDRQAVRRALVAARTLSRSKNEARGLEAYDAWANALASKEATQFGCGYNAQCWAEARRYAAAFLERLAERNSQIPSLRIARDRFVTVAEHLARVAEIFPFRPGPGFVEEETAIATGVAALQSARIAEAAGIDALADAHREFAPAPS